MFAERQDLSEGVARFNAVRAELFEAMRSPEFDRAHIEARMAEVRAQTAEMKSRFQAATLDAVSNASPEVRGQIKTPVLGRRMLDPGNQ